MALRDKELVGGFTVEGAIGEKFTGVEAGVAAGFVDADQLGQLLLHLGESGKRKDRADAIWVQDCVGVVAGGTGSASSAVVIPLPGPQPGRYFEITSVVVVGSDDMTPIANSVVVFCVGNPDNPVLTDTRLPGLSGVPFAWQGGPHSIICTNPNRPYAKVYDLGAAQPAVAIVNGWDRPVWADDERSLQGPLSLPPTRRGGTSAKPTPADRFADPSLPPRAGEDYDPPNLPTEAGSYPPAAASRRRR